MSRLRTIKPEFWTSEQVVECSRNARLLFVGLWNFCDDFGRLNFSPKQIKGLIFPCDDLTTADINEWIGELLAKRLIGLYSVEDKSYLIVTGWHHQRIDKRQPAKFPEPPANVPLSFDFNSTNVPGTLATDRIGAIKESKKEKKLTQKKESLGSEVNGVSPNGSHSASVPFDEFYAAYPKHVDPKDAAAKFASAVKSGADPAHIVSAAKQWAEAWRLAGTEKQFIPAPAVWLNRGSYDSTDLPNAKLRTQTRDSPWPPDVMFSRD